MKINKKPATLDICQLSFQIKLEKIMKIVAKHTNNFTKAAQTLIFENR